MTIIKLLLAFISLFLILVVEVGVAHVLNVVGTRALGRLRRAMHEFMGRKNRGQRLGVLLILFYRFAGKRHHVVFVCALFAMQTYLLLAMKGTNDPDKYVASAMGVVATAMLASVVLLHSTKLYRWFYTSHFAKGVWAIVAAAAAWYGHSVTKSELNWTYGVAGEQLSAAFQVGTFIRTFGILSVLLAIPTLLMEVAFMATLFDSRKYGKVNKGRRRRTLLAIYGTFFIAYMGVQIATVPATNSAYVDAVLADVAWLADTYPEKACTGIDRPEGRRVVFTNGSAADAMVFEAPDISSVPLRRWQNKEAKSAQMKLVDFYRGCQKFVGTPLKASNITTNRSTS